MLFPVSVNDASLEPYCEVLFSLICRKNGATFAGSLVMYTLWTEVCEYRMYLPVFYARVVCFSGTVPNPCAMKKT